MAWRGLHISEPARLSLKTGQLYVDRAAEPPVTFPIEDVAWIILDTQQVEITGALLAACMQSSVPLICSDDKHVPCGMLLPFHQHWRQAHISKSQLNASGPLKKRLWQSIVRKKIDNQATLLDRVQIEGGDTLRSMRPHVRSGDPGNVEARAARYYWQRVFIKFRRQDGEDLRNSMLNYSYAILRGAVARGVAAAGLLPAFGIHHQNAQNAFNLVDDLLEVFRPVADQLVFELSGYGQRPEGLSLDIELRRELVKVMSSNLVFGGEQLTILVALDRTVTSLVRAFDTADYTELELPSL